jgi:hypothetical protein
MPGYYGQKGREKRMALDFLKEAYNEYQQATGKTSEQAEYILSNPKKCTIKQIEEMERILDSEL